MRAARQLYGQFRESFGWKNPEIDALSLDEAEEIVLHWSKEPTVGQMLRAYFGIGKREEDEGDAREAPTPSAAPREVSEEEFRRIADSTRAFAEKHGGPRNPFL